MKKRKTKRESLLSSSSSSSSWRENPYPSRKNSDSVVASADRCLPGFFHFLVSTFNLPSSRRKSLTFGSKKREQTIAVSDSQAEANDVGNRLDAETVILPDGESQPLAATAGETRRLSLVGALEKCDRDLAELQKTIDVIKTTFLLHQKLSVPPTAAPENSKPSNSVTGDAVVPQQTQINKTTTSAENTDTATDTDTEIFRKGNNVDINTLKFDYNVCRNHQNMIMIKKRSPPPPPARGAVPVRTVSKSMVESVNQVCDDVAWGERREVGRIGLTLHDQICRDLIVETIRELSSSSSSASSPLSPSCFAGSHHRRRSSGSLPLDACRRRLVF